MTHTVEPPPEQQRPKRRRGSTPEAPPRLAEGIELIGEYEGSGYKEAPYIARRADGQVIQLTYLLHLVASQADGQRDFRAVGAAVTEEFGRKVSAGNVQFLVEKQLRPLGVLAAADGSSPEIEKTDPLLALKFRVALVPERAVGLVTSIFKPLFLPPVMFLAIAALVALDVWLFFIHGIGAGVREAVYQPLLLVAFFGAVVLATVFHEIGHASACRYGGAKPGVLGAGIYVVWPVFYCDVTDAYRLGKAGRLRTDLGGVYFNGIFALITAGAYFLTSFEPLLLIILLQHFAVLQQLMPLLRLDGYYIMSDLTGVPDILTRIRPILRSLLPGRKAGKKVDELKPWVRVTVSAYVLTLIPVLLVALVLMLISAPRVFATAYDSIGVQYDKVGVGLDDGKGFSVAAAVLQLVAITLPCLGMIFTSGRLGSRVGKGAWGWSEGDPLRRGMVVATAAGLIGLAAFTWWPNGEYRPIQPGEKGTVQGGLKAVKDVPSGRPSLTPERRQELGGARTVREQGGDFRKVEGAQAESAAREAGRRSEGGAREPSQSQPQEEQAPAPGEEAPAAARARGGDRARGAGAGRARSRAAGAHRTRPRRAPDGAVRPPRILTLLLVALLSAVLAVPWAPAAWGDGEDRPSGDNAAQSFNEKDGSSVFDLAFDVREVSNGVVDQTNSAVAYASCENCQTVAIAIQIVLVSGMADVVTPSNYAIAVNEECTTCQTLALAYQFVLGGGRPLEFTKEGRRQLKRIQRAFKELGKSGLTVDEIRAKAQELADQIRALLDTELVPAKDRDDDGEDDDDDRDGDRRDDARESDDDGTTTPAEPPESQPAPGDPAEPYDPSQGPPPATTEEAPPPTTTEPAPEDGATTP